MGLRVLASGDFLGGARCGDPPSEAAERVEGWVERAVALGSPILRVTSGFYRADLATQPDAIEAERWLSATYRLADHVDAIAHAAAAGRRGAIKVAFDHR